MECTIFIFILLKIRLKVSFNRKIAVLEKYLLQESKAALIVFALIVESLMEAIMGAILLKMGAFSQLIH